MICRLLYKELFCVCKSIIALCEFSSSKVKIIKTIDYPFKLYGPFKVKHNIVPFVITLNCMYVFN